MSPDAIESPSPTWRAPWARAIYGEFRSKLEAIFLVPPALTDVVPVPDAVPDVRAPVVRAGFALGEHTRLSGLRLCQY